VKLKCPKCGSKNITGAYDNDDQAFCLDCEHNGYIEDTIYGKGFEE